LIPVLPVGVPTRLRILAALAILIVPASPRAALASPSSAGARAAAQTLIDDAITAMGGDRLRDLSALHLELQQVAHRIDDSERAAAPYWLNIRSIVEDRDERGGRFRQAVVDASAQWVVRNTVLDDGRLHATGGVWLGQPYWVTVHSAGDRLPLSPERILFTAGAAADLRRLPDVVRHGAVQHHVRFSWRTYPVDLYLDAASHRPTEVESVQTDRYNLAQTAWGDVRWRTDFLFWRREPNGLVYPHQWSVSRNGEPYLDEVITALRTDAAPAPSDLGLPKAALDAFKGSVQLPYADRPIPDEPNALRPIGRDLWLIEGSWNVVVARQPDGLVVIECPQSGGYSAKVLALLARKFPGVRVKAMISTTDSLWHFAGLRTYVARGVPIYALDVTLPLLRRFVAAPHRLAPDELQRHPRTAKWRPVAGPTSIGSGDTKVVVYPIRGQGDERMLMVYAPSQRLLYGSSNDVIAVAAKPSVGTFNLPELVESVHRHGLEVDRFVSIHTGEMAWRDVQDVALTHPAVAP
jgi:hypothetical protein